MRDVDEGRAELVLDALELELHLLAQLHVERAEGLVEQERGGVVHQRSGERDALLLASRELPRTAFLEALELDDAKHVHHARPMLLPRNAFHLQPEHDVVVDRHVREEGVLLKHHVHRTAVREHGRHVFALEEDATLVGPLEAGDHAERRRLPATARAEHREELPFADLERHVVDGDRVAEALADALECDSDARVGHGGGESTRRAARRPLRVP